MIILEYLTDHYEYSEGQNFFRFEKVVDIFPASKKKLEEGLIASIHVIPERRWFWVSDEKELADIAIKYIDFWKGKPFPKVNGKIKRGMDITDKTPMPFGKHKGIAMANVPADYLIWIFENNKCSPQIANYIRNNLDILRKEIANSKKGIR